MATDSHILKICPQCASIMVNTVLTNPKGISMSGYFCNKCKIMPQPTFSKTTTDTTTK